MTTKVTVDVPSDVDKVRVAIFDGAHVRMTFVTKGTSQDFYVYGEQELTVQELKDE